MLRDLRLVGLDNAWLHCLPAVVSICEYTVSNKGAYHVTVMTVGDHGGYAPMPYILCGQLPPLSPPPWFLCNKESKEDDVCGRVVVECFSPLRNRF